MEEVGVLCIFRSAVLRAEVLEHQVRVDNVTAWKVAVHGWRPAPIVAVP